MTIEAPPRQPSLFDREELPGLAEPLYRPEMTLQDRFEAFHGANPHVYARLRELATGLVRAGRSRLGMKMLFEVLRWQTMISTEGDPWKLNNSYTSLYARKLMAEVPELADAFETRELKA